MELKRLEDQVMVVVGASSGIGRATALRCAARGAKLVVSARSAEGLQSLVDEIAGSGGTARPIVADTAIPEQVAMVADYAANQFGRIDTWVHAAAVSLYATFAETTPTEFKQVIETNLLGQVYGAMAALPHLKREGRGALIHISSIEARCALPYQSAYASSKHGMNGFLKVLRLELKHDGLPISVTEVRPASINTPFFNKARTKLGVKPMGMPPFYEPEVVADAIAYAAEHPTREIIVGGAGKAMVTLQKVAPGLFDALMDRTGFSGQRTDEPKSAADPNNMFAPIGGHNQVRGDFSHLAKSVSGYTWLRTHPLARAGVVAGSLAGLAALVAARMGRD